MNTHLRGRRYERLAAAYLAERGWAIRERNVRHRRKEVDLIVQRGSVVAFVEVKGRRGSAFGDPLEAITLHKRREIRSVARWWIERRGRPGESYRFDAIAVLEDASGGTTLRHVEDAWR